MSEGNYLKASEECLNESSNLDKAVAELKDVSDIHAEVKDVDVYIDGYKGDKTKSAKAIYISILAQAARDGDTLDDKMDEIKDAMNKAGVKIEDENIAMSKSGTTAYMSPEFKNLDFDDFVD